MTVYNTTLLSNIVIVNKAKQWYARNLISTEQMAKVIAQYPVTYFKPNIFIKIGLFVFTWFLVSATLGIYSLFTSMIFTQFDSFMPYGIVSSALFAGLSFFALEKLVKWRNWFSNGIDDALLYIGLCSVVTLIAFCFSNMQNGEDIFLLVCIFFFPVLLFAMLRYIDRVVALFLMGCFYCISFLLIMKLGSVAKFIMPFAFMALSLAVYFYVKKQMKKEEHFHLMNCFKVIKIIALLVFYLSGNYYVIRESSIAFFDLVILPGFDIPLAFVFYAFTALVPLIYLYFSLKNIDKLLLLVSLILIAAAALTFKYYFSLGHPEITLTLGGLVMITLAYISIRYLKVDRKGITFKEDPDEDNFLKSNAEALIIAQSFSTPVADPGNTPMGGGSFGGGGSGNKF
jgi:hypothetical protein